MIFIESRNENNKIIEQDLGGAFYRVCFLIGKEESHSLEGEESRPQNIYNYIVNQTEYKQSIDTALEQAIQEINDINQLKTLVLLRINRKYDNIVNKLTSLYPESEVQTWTIQKAEAESYTGDESKVPFLKNLAIIRNIELSDLVQKIKEKNEVYIKSVASLTGIRQKLEDQINSLKDIEQIRNVNWPNEVQ